MAGTLSATNGFARAELNTPRASQARVHLASSPAYYHTFHPARWTVINGEWLPNLGKLTVEPGVNNVSKGGDHYPAKTHYERRGWTVIPWETVRLYDSERVSYVAAPYINNKGQLVHLSIWETPVTAGGSTVIRSDTAGYAAWLRSLVVSGVLPQPEPEVLEALTEQAQQRADRYAGNPKDPRFLKARERVEAMRAATAKLYQEPEPEPVGASTEAQNKSKRGGK